MLGAEEETVSESNWRNTAYLRGYIYEICIYNFYKSEFNDEVGTIDCGPNMCTQCPVEECLTECEYNEFYIPETGLCGTCLEDCDDGCQRTDNCNTCHDTICGVCPEWVICELCLLNATPSPIECKCDEGYYYNIEQNICDSCDPKCSSCDSKSEQSCDACEPPFMLLPDSRQCETECPTGWENVDNVCESNGVETGCFVFDDITNVWFMDPADSGSVAYGGNLETEEDSDPLIVYRRGAYLNGSTSYITIHNFIFHHTFTIEMWTRINSDGTLFSINTLKQDAEDYLTYDLVNGILKLTYFPENDTGILNLNSVFSAAKWHHPVVCVSWSSES